MKNWAILEEMVKLMGNFMKLLIQGKMENCENCENCASGKCDRKKSEKDRKKNRQNQDIVFTFSLHYRNLLLLEDQNIGFWQWMRPLI